MGEFGRGRDINKAPRVSVVMPSYNHARFIGEAIEGVLRQSFEDFEFVIVDDGSSDGTQAAIRRYSDSRIRYEEFATNRGACEALNRCIALARGEYIAVTSSDDYFLPGKIARQVGILDSDPALAAVFGLPEFIDENGAAIPSEGNPFADLFSVEPANRFAWLRHFFLQGNALCHSTAMVRKRIYDELGIYDVALRQLPDLDMWVRICARYPIRVLAEPLTAFRVLNGQQNNSAPTRIGIRRHLWEHGRILRRYWTMDEATLQRAFGADIPQEVVERGLPMPEQLAMMVAARGLPHGHQVFALETLEAGIARGLTGVEPLDLHRLSGELDPFRITELHNLMLQQQESAAVQARLGERAANAERERDEALLRVSQLEQAEKLLSLELLAARDLERQAVEASREAHDQEVAARRRADAQASLQAKLRADALANLSAQADHHQRVVLQLKARVDELQALLNDLQQSDSWRLTLPLRLVGMFVRTRLNRLGLRVNTGERSALASVRIDAGS